MKTRIDWIHGRIDISKMGRGWTIVNWSFLACGLILASINLVGNRVFDIPWMYVIYAGFVYVLAFVVYLITVLFVFAKNKNIVALDNGMMVADEYQLNPYGNAIIDETKHETTFIKPQTRWQYGALYIGLAIWLSIRAFDLFKALFKENHDPMPLNLSLMTISDLALCAGVTIAIAVIGVQQFVKTAQRTDGDNH